MLSEKTDWKRNKIKRFFNRNCKFL